MITIQDYKVNKVYVPYIYLTETGIYLYFPNCQINDWDFKKNLYDILAELQKRTEQPLRYFFVLTGADPEIECYYCSNSTVFERYDMTVEEVLEFEHELGNVIFDEIQLQELKSVFENMTQKVKTDIYGNTYIYKNGEYVEISEIDSEFLFKLTLFGGWLGLHLFYQKKIVSGILYLFTLGIFGIGWTLDVIDWGTLKVPEHLKDVAENPFEGEQRYFESRRITFRESDAPVVYSALNGISFERLEESLKNLPTILNRGSYEIEKIPIDDIDNVCSLAKANNVNLYVDLHGNYSTPEAETLSVLFNSFDRHMMDAIMNRIFVEKSTFSHAVNTEQKKGIGSPDKIKQKKSLKELMDYAREKQGSYQQDRSIVEKDPLIR